MTTALSKAMQGEKVPDKQQRGALAEAVGKLKNLGGRISKAKEKSEAVADAVIATAEMQGAAFGASFAEGYFGEEKMDVGPVDLRVGGGLLVGGYGLYQSMTGKGGSHSLAIGNGLLAIGLGRVGRNAGKALAEKREKKGQEQPANGQAAAPAQPAPAQLPAAQGDFGDLVRDIFLTPPDDALAVIQAAAVAGRSAVRRARQAQRVQTLGGRPCRLPPTCANCDGYGWHAGVVIGAKDRKGVEGPRPVHRATAPRHASARGAPR